MVGVRAPKAAARSGGGVATSDRPVAAADGSLRPPVAKLSKDAYRRRRIQLDEEVTGLTERKRRLEATLGDPGVHGNFLELRRVSGELATVDQALAAAEEAWLEMEEAAP